MIMALTFTNHLGQTIDLANCEDGEVLGLAPDGCVICWDKPRQIPYDCGDTLEDFGVHCLRDHERERVNVRP